MNSDDKFQAIIELMRQQQEEHQEQMRTLLEQLATRQPAGSSLHKDLSNRMEKFNYCAEDNATFERWYARYQVILETDAATMNTAARVNLITEKLSSVDYAKFADTILPLTIATIPFVDAVTTLKRLFGRKESQFSLRYKCLKTTKGSSESYSEYGPRVNQKCEKFDVTQFSADDLKVLVFVQGINKSEESLTLEKILVKLDNIEIQRKAATDGVIIPKMKLQDAINYAERISNLKVEKKMVLTREEYTDREVNHVRKNQQPSNSRKSWPNSQYTSSSTILPKSSSSFTTPNALPRSPCNKCAGLHWHNDCPFNGKTATLAKEKTTRKDSVDGKSCKTHARISENTIEVLPIAKV